MKSTSKRKIVISIVCYAVALVLIALFVKIWFFTDADINDTVADTGEQVNKYIDDAEQSDDLKIFNNTVDFEKLKKENSDIYAWITIPDTAVNLPIMQNSKDDNKYFRKSFDEKYAIAGCIYSQASYNSLDMNDMVTVLYGHNMHKDSMFGGLKNYLDKAYMNDHKYIYVFTPQEVLTYEIFMAVPFDNTHILYTWNFDNDKQYTDFLEQLLNFRGMSGYVDKNAVAKSGEKLIVLSTCYPGNKAYRLLVIGKCINTQNL